MSSACYMPTGNSIDNTINNNNNTIYYHIYLYSPKYSSTQEQQNNVYSTSKTDKRRKETRMRKTKPRDKRTKKQSTENRKRLARHVVYILQAGAVPHGPRLAGDAVRKGPPRGAKFTGSLHTWQIPEIQAWTGLHTKLKLIIYGKQK